MQACKVSDDLYLDWTNSNPGISEKKVQLISKREKFHLLSSLIFLKYNTLICCHIYICVYFRYYITLCILGLHKNPGGNEFKLTGRRIHLRLALKRFLGRNFLKILSNDMMFEFRLRNVLNQVP